ncbi:MAG TPA: SDR family oxidoreductase [Rubrivivax sp.]|nr:SDR family oxidoreductase [Rubrivivax sp.]
MTNTTGSKPRTVIVTGAASGIGAATVRMFAQRGDFVVLADLAPMDKVLEEIAASGGNGIAVQGDIAAPGQAKKIVAQALEATGRVDVLINNAAYAIGGNVETTSEEDFDRTFQVNVKAGFLLTREVIAPMRAAGSGSILFTTAAAGHMGMSNLLAYGTSKAALVHMVRVLAGDHVRDGIRVNAVSPAGVRTPMRATAARIMGITDPAVADALSPTGRPTEPEEVAELFYYLASPVARQINGHTIVIDGGTVAAPLSRR